MESEALGNDNQRFKSGIDVFALKLVLTDCQVVWILELGELGVVGPVVSTEFVARLPSSDEPEKLIALVDALVLEMGIHDSLTYENL